MIQYLQILLNTRVDRIEAQQEIIIRLLERDRRD